GLWEIGLTKTQSGQILWDGRRRFRGVAFWQDFPTPDNGRIRCHGPQSIFSEAWRSLNLPPSQTDALLRPWSSQTADELDQGSARDAGELREVGRAPWSASDQSARPAYETTA